MTNHRPIKTLSLTQRVIDDPRLRPYLDEALSEANNRDLGGMALYEALFYTGVAVGAERTLPAYREAMYEQLDIVRGLNRALEVLVPKVSDLEVLEEVNKLVEQVRGILTTRAQYLTGMHVDAASEMYGVSKETLTDGSDPAEWGIAKLSSVGFTAYQKAPKYFYAWNLAVKGDKIGRLKCYCSECLNDLFPKDRQLHADVEMSEAMVRNDGLDKLFAAYGLFLINQLREELYRLLEGADEHGTVQAQDAEEATRKMLAIFRKPAGNNETNDEG
jgi:hypothetical protein